MAFPCSIFSAIYSSVLREIPVPRAAAAAAIGSLLSIKPVLQIQGDKLDSYAKVLTVKQAKSKMIMAIKKDIETRFNKINSENIKKVMEYIDEKINFEELEEQ